MNLRQHTLALILAAGLSASAFAATTAPVPTPVNAVAPVADIANASVSMTQALATAEKQHAAKSTHASLRQMANYGLVWDVKLLKGETRIRTLVDAKSGNVLASNVMEIKPEPKRHHARAPRGEGRRLQDGQGRQGMGPRAQN